MVTRISPSQIETWEECRLKWFKSREPDRPRGKATLPMRGGTAVHAAWEPFLQAPPSERTFELLSMNFDLSWQQQFDEADEMDDAGLKKWETARKNSRRMLENYWTMFGKDEELWPGTTEQTIETPVYGDVYIRARLDYLAGRNIHELKTTGSQPDVNRYLFLNPQVKYQALLVKDVLKLDPVIHLTILWPTGAERVSWEPPDSVLDITRQKVGEVAYDMARGDIPPTESWKCGMCPYENECLTRVAAGG
jgi:hypothetical protein